MARQPEFLTEQQRMLGRYLAALREAAGLYQADIARAVPCHRTTVTHAEAGSQLPASDFWERADQLVGAHGALIARYDELVGARAAYLAEQQAKRRTRAQVTVEQLTVDPLLRSEQACRGGSDDGLPALAVAGAATEAMEFTQAAALTAVGRGTLEHLELVISDLNQAYSKNPPAGQFIVARTYRLRVDKLIRGRRTLKELQALYVCAAWLSELLAWLAYDLGNFRTARAYALDCYAHANQVGHGELCGWAANAMASIMMDSEHPASAAKAAMQGVAKVSTSHPLTVRLHAHAARAYARLGQREPCETLFGEARQLYERLPARAPCRFTMDTGIHASYAMTAFPASAYLWLENFDIARTYGEAALAAMSSDSSPYAQAQVRFELAKALVGLGAPDDAVALGSQALTLTRMVPPLIAHAHDLDRVLVSRYPRLACAREFHEQYRHVAQRSTAGEGGS